MQKNRPTSPWPVLLLLFVPFLLYLDAIIGGKTFLQADFHCTFYPMRHLLEEMGRAGQIFFWDPHKYSGVPLAGNIQAALFYPLNLPYMLLRTDLAILIMVLLSQSLAGIFMYLYLRRRMRDEASALAGGVIYGLSGYLIANACMVSLICAAIWLPLILLCFDKSIEEPGRLSLPWAAWGGVAMGLSILAGFPQHTAYSIIFLAISALSCSALIPRGGKPVPFWMPPASACFICATGFLLSAVQLLPTLTFVRFFPRNAITDPSFYGGGAYLTTLSWLPHYLFPSFTPIPQAQLGLEMNIYLGLPPLLLALASWLHKERRGVILLWVMVLLFFILSFGLATPLYHAVLSLPVVGKFRCPVRWLFLVNFCICVLAALGTSALLGGLSRKSRAMAAALLILTLLLVQGIHARRYLVPMDNSLFIYPPEATLPIPGGGRFLTTPGNHVPLANMGDVSGGRNIIGYDPMVLIYYFEYLFYNESGRLPSNEELQKAAWFNYALPISRIDTPMMRLLQLRRVITGRASLTEGITVTTRALPALTPRAFVTHAWRALPDPLERLQWMGREQFDPRREVILECAPPGERSDVGNVSFPSSREARAEIREDSPNRVIVTVADNPERGFLVLADPWFVEWKATANGAPAPLLRAYHALRAVPVPRGDSTIIFDYDPTSFRLGLAITAVTIASMGAFFLISRRRKRAEGGGTRAPAE